MRASSDEARARAGEATLMSFHAPEGTVLVEVLGSGGFFEVAVVQAGAARIVCKRLTTRAVREAEGRAAIVREAQLLATVRHPALPALVRVGSDPHGPFVLETVAPGASLRALVEGWAERGRSVPPRLVAHLAQAAAEALAELAELADDAGPLGFVHGDLGPDHVLVGPLGEVRFVDLGAARCRGLGTTASAAERGTLPYVAPEIARGEASSSAAGDVYALAATMLYLATGRPPCDAIDEAAMLVEVGERGVRAERLGEASGLDARGRDAFRAALSFDPAARLARARDLARAFEPQ